MPLVPLFNDGQTVKQAAPVTAPQGQLLRVVMQSTHAARAFATPNLPHQLADRSGTAALGQALGQVSQVAGAVALKKAEAINIRRVAEADASMAKQVAEFENWKLQNPDETTWEAEWQNRVAGMSESLFVEGLSPVAREEIQNRFTQFQGQSAIRLSTDVARTAFRKAGETLEAQALEAFAAGDSATGESHVRLAVKKGYMAGDVAARLVIAGKAQAKSLALENLDEVRRLAEPAGDSEKYSAAVNDAVSKGALTEQQAALKMQDFQTGAVHAKKIDDLMQIAHDDPHRAAELARAHNIQGPDLIRIENYAAGRIQQRRAESLAEIEANAKRGIIPNEDQLENNTYLSAGDKAMVTDFLLSKPLNDPNGYADLMSAAANFTGDESSPEYAVISQRISMALEGDLKTKALAKLSESATRKDPDALTRSMNEVFGLLADDMKSGRFGPMHSPLSDLKTELPPKIRAEVDLIKREVVTEAEKERLKKEPTRAEYHERKARHLWWERNTSEAAKEAGETFESSVVEDMAAKTLATRKYMDSLTAIEKWKADNPKATPQQLRAEYDRSSVRRKSKQDAGPSTPLIPAPSEKIDLTELLNRY